MGGFYSLIKLLLRLDSRLASIHELMIEMRRQQQQTLQLPGQEKWLDSADLKQQYNLSDSTIYRLAKRNILHPVMVGNRKYFRESEIQQYGRVLLKRIRD